MDDDGDDDAALSGAERLQKAIVARSKLHSATGEAICEFPEERGTFLVPRGRFGMELFDSYVRMHSSMCAERARPPPLAPLAPPLLPAPPPRCARFTR